MAGTDIVIIEAALNGARDRSEHPGVPYAASAARSIGREPATAVETRTIVRGSVPG